LATSRGEVLLAGDDLAGVLAELRQLQSPTADVVVCAGGRVICIRHADGFRTLARHVVAIKVA
jgi:hypothetical protein